MTTIILGNGNNLSVFDDNSNGVVRHGFETRGCACSGGQG